MKLSFYVLFLSSVALLLPSQIVLADGLDDLKSALSRLKNNSDINAEYEYRYTNVNDDDEDERSESGDVVMLVDSNTSGLQLTYSSDIMQALKYETALQTEDEDADTPTRNALRDISAVRISGLLNAAQEIEQLLDQANFIDETPLQRGGKALRQLNFTLPLEALIRDKQTRKHVKKFSNAFQIIIDEDGVPMESSLTYEGKGRAYIVIRFEASGDSSSRYQVHDGRLVRVQNEDINRWDTTFGKGEQISNETLHVASKKSSVAKSSVSRVAW